MDCSAFRRHHVAYVDDTLPGDVLVAAVRHAAECPACARHDTAVRRSLLVARNAPRLECSPDFAARLDARLHAALAEERAARAVGGGRGALDDDWTPGWWELTSTQIITHLAAHRRTRQALAAAAVVASVSAGAVLRGAASAGAPRSGGELATVPFGSLFAGAPAAPLGEAVFGQRGIAAGAASPGATLTGTSPVREPAPDGAASNSVHGAPTGPDGATLVSYDGTMDAGALVAPAATGVPVWAAAMFAGEVPAVLWRSAGASSVELVRDGQ